MEVHVSSDDRNFIYNICQDITERIGTDLKGYASYSGYNLQNDYEFKVFQGDKDVTDKFKKRITFGEMLNLMYNFKGVKLYFQREDWIGTHNFLAADNSNGKNIFIALYHEDSRYKKGTQFFDDNGIPIIDSIPYIPTYDDMFIHSWIICDFETPKNYDEEE